MKKVISMVMVLSLLAGVNLKVFAISSEPSKDIDMESPNNILAEQEYLDRRIDNDVSNIESFSTNEKSDEAVSLASLDEGSQYMITEGRIQVLQGQTIVIPKEQFEVVPGENYTNRFNGTVTFESNNHTWIENYYNIDYYTIFDSYSPTEIRLLATSDVPVGEYLVKVELDNGTVSITGDFSVVIAENLNNTIIIGSDKSEISLQERIDITYSRAYYDEWSESTQYDTGSCYGFALSDNTAGISYIFDSNYIPLRCEIPSKKHHLTSWTSISSENGYYPQFSSNSVEIEVKSIATRSIIQDGVVEIYRNSRGIYNGEIAFGTNIFNEDDWATLLINKENGNKYYDGDYSTIIGYNAIGDSTNGYSGVNITYLSDMCAADEYEGYIFADGTLYGPINIKKYDYSLGDNYYTSSNNEMSLHYYLDDTKLFDENDDFSISIEIISDEHNTVAEYANIVPQYKYIYKDYANFNVKIPTPNISQNGAYILHAELNFSDGSTKVLDDRHIYIGDYEIVNYIQSLTHGDITPKTKTIGIQVNFDNYVENPDEFNLSLINSDGDKVGKSTNWYYYPNSSAMSDNSTCLIYIVEIDNLLSYGDEYEKNQYTVQLNYTGNKTMIGDRLSYTIDCREGIQILSSKRVGTNTYSLYIEGVSAGTYPTYAGEWDDEPNGSLIVNQDGSATLSIDSEDEYDITFYIDVEENKCEEVSFWVNNSEEDLPPTAPTLSSVMPEYIKTGEKSIQNIEFSIFNKYIMGIDKIQEVQLISNGNIVANGENVRYSTYDSDWYYFNNMDLEYFDTYYYVDFPSIQTEKIENKSLTMRVILSDGVVIYDIPVLDDDEGNVKGQISLTNTANADGGRITLNNSNINANYIALKDNIEFKVNHTNKTVGNVILQKANTETNTYDEVASISLSELERTEANGYIYTGKFLNQMENGCFYRVKFGNAYSYWFKAIDAEYYLNYYNKKADICLSKPSIYMRGLNIDFDHGNFSAFYNNTQGEKLEIPMSIERKYTSSAYFKFDFSDVAAFDTLDLHLCYNGTDIDTIKITDCRNKQEIKSKYISYYNGKESLYMYGSNIDKIENLKLKLWKIEDYRGYNVLSKSPIKEISLNIPSSDSTGYYFDISYIGVPEGLYVYALFADGKPVGYDDMIYIPSNQSSEISAVLNKKLVSGSSLIVDIENTSKQNIKNATLIVCAYGNNGALLKATTKAVNINAKTSTGDIPMDTVEGAEQYKVFLWDGLNTMKPLMK